MADCTDNTCQEGEDKRERETGPGGERGKLHTTRLLFLFGPQGTRRRSSDRVSKAEPHDIVRDEEARPPPRRRQWVTPLVHWQKPLSLFKQFLAHTAIYATNYSENKQNQ